MKYSDTKTISKCAVNIVTIILLTKIVISVVIPMIISIIITFPIFIVITIPIFIIITTIYSIITTISIFIIIARIVFITRPWPALQTVRSGESLLVASSAWNAHTWTSTSLYILAQNILAHREASFWKVVHANWQCPNSFWRPPPSLWCAFFQHWGEGSRCLLVFFWDCQVELKSAQTILTSFLTPPKTRHCPFGRGQKRDPNHPGKCLPPPPLPPWTDHTKYICTLLHIQYMHKMHILGLEQPCKHLNNHLLAQKNTCTFLTTYIFTCMY